MVKSKNKSAIVDMPKAELMQIPIALIIPDPNQPRKHFDEAKLKELADSIASVGVMQSIAVYRNDADGYNLIAGERRYRASILAGKEDIPAMVYPALTEEMIKEIQITENLHRQDMNPMEESDAFFDLTKRGMTTAADIAKRIHKSEGYVYDRLALQNCIEAVQDNIRNGNLPITHGKQFARLNLVDQQELYMKLVGRKDGISLPDIRREIDYHFSMNLNEAPFDIHSEELLPQAGKCTNCPKRSGCNQLLFDDIQSHDICFDKVCFQSKSEMFIEKIIKHVEGCKRTAVKISGRTSYGMENDIAYNQEWDKVDEKHTDWPIYGVVVERGYSDLSDKVGTWFPIALSEEAAERLGITQPEITVGDEHEELDDTLLVKAQPGNKPPRVDHDEAFTQRLQTKIINQFKETPTTLIAGKDFNVKQLADEMACIYDDNIEMICGLLGIELVQSGDDERGQYNFVATARQLYDKTEFGYDYYVQLFSILNSAEQMYWNRSDLDGIKSDFPSLFFDIYDEMDAYESETGHKFSE